MYFPIRSGRFAGMTQAQLLDARAKAQQALIDLSTGNKPTAIAYSQVDGSRSVSFALTSKDGINELIRAINAALGVSGRRAIGVVFR